MGSLVLPSYLAGGLSVNVKSPWVIVGGGGGGSGGRAFRVVGGRRDQRYQRGKSVGQHHGVAVIVPRAAEVRGCQQFPLTVQLGQKSILPAGVRRLDYLAQDWKILG